MTLSWSRKRVVVWARSKDMLSWQACQTACFRRLGGVPAVLRIDNVKTGIATGAGSWGVVNPTYGRYAGQLKFHVDACQPRQPQAKGKVERGIRDQRAALDPYGEVFDSLEALQAWTDARLDERAARLRCPATGTSVADAWETERRLLTPLPATLPEPFDVAVRRPVGIDGLVAFDGRQYSVPFGFVRREVEVRGVAGRVQIWKDRAVIAEHPRGGPALIAIDALGRAEREGRLGDKIRFLARPSLLIVDEIGYLPITSGGANLFFQLVNARYEKGAMILTSNRGFAEWGEVFGDPVVATALLDRLLHHAVVVQIEGASYRLREHADLVPEHARAHAAITPPPPPKRRGRPPKNRSADHLPG